MGGKWATHNDGEKVQVYGKGFPRGREVRVGLGKSQLGWMTKPEVECEPRAIIQRDEGRRR